MMVGEGLAPVRLVHVVSLRRVVIRVLVVNGLEQMGYLFVLMIVHSEEKQNDVIYILGEILLMLRVDDFALAIRLLTTC